MGEIPAIETERLTKSFGSTQALSGLDLTVQQGGILGLLGPNGAGKTTAVRVLTTLLRPDSGQARVLGFDVVREAAEVRHHIGLTGQYAALDDYLTGHANLIMIGQLGRLSRSQARRRADELLARFELTDAAGRAVKTYSGGMRRRLDLAASLIGQPEVLFLDEPTTGLDPNSRAVMWEIIRELAAEGTTLLLTTQYLDEADQLANQVAVIDAGRVVAEGTPDQLKAKVGEDRIAVQLAPAATWPPRWRSCGRRPPGRWMPTRGSCWSRRRCRPATASRPTSSGRWTRPGSGSRTSPCAARPWTTCS